MQSKIIAHRGASLVAPENTLEAFAKALTLGAHGIELDVHRSKDGVLVVIHDETVDRTTNGTGYVKDLTFKELRALDAGSWKGPRFKGAKIPALGEVLAWLRGKNILLNVEIKSGRVIYPRIERDVLRLLVKYKYTKNTLISSFNHYSLAQIRYLQPTIRTGVLYMAGLYEPWKYARTLGATAINPFYATLAPQIIKGARRHRMPIYAFTVDDPLHLQLLLRARIAGIITNDPMLALSLQKRLRYKGKK